MKRLAYILSIVLCMLACCTPSDPDDHSSTSIGTGSGGSTSCGTYNGRTLYKGPEGGCYYINKNGNKTYVDRINCKC